MAGASLLVLLDDIALVLDDVALMTKVAAKQTAGVLGDDLALNAEQVSGIRAERELPVVWAVAKGSLKNKLILVPTALTISWLAPWLIMPLLMLGGAYLCFEGFEKLAHPLLHTHAEDEALHAELTAAVANSEIDLVAFERDKIKGAVRTDFVLSAEIIVITLGVVATAAFATKVAVVSGIALIMTAGVYGLVAVIVKLDDVGLHLCQKPGLDLWTKIQHKVGLVFLRRALPDEVAGDSWHSGDVYGGRRDFDTRHSGSALLHRAPSTKRQRRTKHRWHAGSADFFIAQCAGGHRFRCAGVGGCDHSGAYL